MDPLAIFAAVFAAFYAAHQVADHWVQTQHQADHKGASGAPGRLACAAHVATYGLTQLATLGLLALTLGLRVHPLALATGMTVSLGTHYVIDRRVHLRRLADRLGKSAAWLDHGGGLYALDQSAHVGCLAVAALVIAL